MSEWISVQDRLPELKERVLILCRGQVCIGNRVKVLSNAPYVRWYAEGPCFISSTDFVTHWMPLPEVPHAD